MPGTGSQTQQHISICSLSIEFAPEWILVADTARSCQSRSFLGVGHGAMPVRRLQTSQKGLSASAPSAVRRMLLRTWYSCTGWGEDLGVPGQRVVTLLFTGQKSGYPWKAHFTTYGFIPLVIILIGVRKVS